MLTEESVHQFRLGLAAWGQKHRKEYPWRKTREPYRILVAEFMLHRTQARQVIPVYETFLKRYPTLRDAATADLEGFVTLLHPLGLRWRVLLMKKALAYLWECYGGVPDREDLLLAAPGIGPYIANATVCFSRNVCRALVDTNTVRVVGRFFGLPHDEGARRRKSMIKAIEQACDPGDPRNYYYSLIDFAHEVCTKKDPLCTQCPLNPTGCRWPR